MMIAPMLVLIYMAVLSTATARADLNVTVLTTDDIDLDLTTFGEGALLSVEYNGRDLLQEIEDYLKTISDLRSIIVSLAMRNDIEELEDQLVDLEYGLDKLINELNLILNDLYSKIVNHAHIIGINPLNTTVALNLISGNMTIVDYIDDILIDLNATDQEFTSIQLQFENIYAGMMVHDTVIMGTRSTLREINTTLSDAIVDLERVRADILGVIAEVEFQLTESDAHLQGQIDVHDRDLQELRDEISSLQDQIIKEGKARENITLMFGAFSLIVIALKARTRAKR